jgi:biopolymer transport protein TolR
MASLRSSRANKRNRAISEINVVPYIDVMLVLLVIFMTTAAFVPTGVVQVPRAGKSDVRPDAYLELSLKKDGQLHLKSFQLPEKIDQPINKKDLAATVQRIRAGKEIPLVIAADGEIAYSKIIELLKDAQDRGIQKVSLLVKK